MRSREATIAAAARALGFSRAGTAPLAPLPVGPFLQAWLAEGRAGEMGYLARRTAERIAPRAPAALAAAPAFPGRRAPGGRRSPPITAGPAPAATPLARPAPSGPATPWTRAAASRT